MSPVMRKRAFCICKNKNADQLGGNREADQRLRFRICKKYILPKSEFQVSSHFLWLYSSVCVGLGRGGGGGVGGGAHMSYFVLCNHNDWGGV